MKIENFYLFLNIVNIAVNDSTVKQPIINMLKGEDGPDIFLSPVTAEHRSGCWTPERQVLVSKSHLYRNYGLMHTRYLNDR